MKKVALLTIFAALMMISSAAVAQTANGTLTVTATVQGSIQLQFNSDASGVALTGSGTNAATLAFGNISAFGALGSPNIVRTVNATSFTVSSAVDVQVNKTNSASANYSLTAQLASAPAPNSFTVGGVAVSNTAAAPITATGAYGGTGTNFPVAINVLFTTPAGAISNTINYTATAN